MDVMKWIIRAFLLLVVILIVLGFFIVMTSAFNIWGIIIGLMFTLQIIIILMLKNLSRSVKQLIKDNK